MNIRHLAQALTFALTLIALSSHARAQTDETPDAMIERALTMRDAGDDVGAHELIVRAYAISATPRNAAQLGLVEQALGLFAPAEQHLAEALAVAGDPWIRRRRARLEQSLELVRQRLGSLVLLTDVPGARVSVGGEVIGTTPFAAPVRVQIGTISVEVSLEGYRTESVSVIVTANVLSRQTVRLQPVPRPPELALTEDVRPAPDSARVLESPTERAPSAPRAEGGSIAGKWWFWTIVGVAIAGTSVGVAVALSSGTTTNAPLVPGDVPAGGVIQTLSLPSW